MTVVVSARVTRPYAIEPISLADAQDIAHAIVVESLDVTRDKLESMAQCLLELDRAPYEALSESRREYVAEGVRLHEARKEVHGLRNELQAAMLTVEIAAIAAVAHRDAEADLRAQLAASRQATAEVTRDLGAMAQRCDVAERALAQMDDTVVVDMVGAA